MVDQFQLPPHIAGRKRERIAETSVAGMGGGLPPHISIQGNQFTLIDASGNEAAAPEKTLECAIVAVSKVMCKRYYDKKFDPSSGDPPVCWSSNGIGPSSQAVSPQNATCHGCPHNERGSAVSAISGAAIKACRDEKYIALYLPKHPDMLFRLILTPGSFKNWGKFEKPFEGQQVDISDVLCEISFEPKTNGVLVFRATDYLPPEVVTVCDQALAERKTVDILTGATDVPFQGALAAPEANRPLASTPSSIVAPTAAFQPTALALAPVASPSEPTQRRRRRTKAEMDAERAQQAAPAPVAQQAPFRPQPAPSGRILDPGSGYTQPPFGIGQAPAPNPEMAGMLKSIFKQG